MSNGISRRDMFGAFLGDAWKSSDKPLKSSRERIRERYFPNLLLTSHTGRSVRFYDDLIKDKMVVVNFMYATCEGICPTVMQNISKVYKAFGKRAGRDIFFYSISLKPEQDTSKVLKEYAQMHKFGGPGWLLLTGDPNDIETLRRKLGFSDPDPKIDKDTSSHIGNLRYGNEPLELWAGCPGMTDPEWIVESISFVDQPKTVRTAKGGRR
jgi:protein SCO1